MLDIVNQASSIGSLIQYPVSSDQRRLIMYFGKVKDKCLDELT